jgi:predicted RNA-binding protein with PIN domain
MGGARQATCLLVDGYNIIGDWPSLNQIRQEAGFEAARRELTETMANYSARQGFNTRLVFDAHLVNAPGAEEPITDNLVVCYTSFGQTADTYIEKVCANLFAQARRHNRVIVASSDRAHRLTVSGYGAECISARQLATDVQFVNRSQHHRSSRRSKPSGRSLLQSLDDEAKEKLTRLRFGIQSSSPANEGYCR